MIGKRALIIIFISLICDLSSCLECKRRLKIIMEDNDNHECQRACEYPAKPKICEYTFTAEWIYSMAAECYECPAKLSDCYSDGCVTADGSVRPTVSINKQMPGPSIQVCHGDTIRVRVVNNLLDYSGLTVHWYGMHQVGSNLMDGVSMITQCPVPSASSFVYKFIANPTGTHWWHAHSGIQRDDGMYGALIVRQPKELERNGNEYDVDDWSHTMSLLDWWSRPTLTVYMMFLSPSKYFDYNQETFGLLVNGKSTGVPVSPLNYPNNYYTPLSTFSVDRNLAYRFRLISSVFGLCSLRVSIDSHRLTIIALDGSEVMPIEVDSFVISPGERVDFVVKTTAKPSTYCINFRGTANSNCTNDGAAILVYPYQKVDFQKCANTFNTYNAEDQVFSDQTQLITETYALETLDQRMYSADEKHTIKLTSRVTAIVSEDGRVSQDGHLTSYLINSIKFSSPSSPFYGPTPVKTCNGTDAKISDGDNDECSCTNVLKIKQGQVVDFVIINLDFLSHVMHLHGHSFRVLAIDTIDIKNIHIDKLVPKIKPEFAVVKDTVHVKAMSYVIIRTIFDNPGYWMFHDQINSHLERGMAMVIQVGSEDEIPKTPPTFPTCGPWSPYDV